MKTRLTKVKTIIQSMWADETAQGATEYILLLVVVVGLALAFKPKISQLLSDKMGEISSSVSGMTSTSQ